MDGYARLYSEPADYQHRGRCAPSEPAFLPPGVALRKDSRQVQTATWRAAAAANTKAAELLDVKTDVRSDRASSPEQFMFLKRGYWRQKRLTVQHPET